MNVKTIEAMTMSDAVKKVKKNYGSDAVILSTRHKKIEGSDQSVVEVKIAVSEQNIRSGASAPMSDSGESYGQSLSVLQDRFDSIDRRLNFMTDQIASRDQISRLETGLKELKILFTQHLRHSGSSDLSGQPESIQQIDQQLSLVGVDSIYKKEVANYLSELPSFNPLKSDQYRSSEEYYRANAIRFMYKKLSVATPIKPVHGCSSIHMFVGGHGVGKTCTIAKVASDLKGAGKTKILLISYDYRKLGLQDALPVYAKILGVSHATIEEADQLEEVVLAHRDCEIILIDTSGGLTRKEQEFKMLLNIKELPLPVDTHLVLSLTEHSSQQEQAIQKFSSLGLQSFVFTKLDESWSCGDIYNQTNRWSIPVSYFSTGPRIPGNLEVASRERVMERIFGI